MSMKWIAGGLGAAAIAGLATVGLLIVSLCAMASSDEEEQRRRNYQMSEALNAAAGSGVSDNAPGKVSGIRKVVLSAYSKGAAGIGTIRPQCRGMRWSVLAGIGAVESNHIGGRRVNREGDITPRIIGPRLDGSGVGGNTEPFHDTDNGALDGDTEYDRAVGPMQFLPSTWNGPSGQDGNNDATKDPHNVFDATLATASYLCGTGKTNLTDTGQLRKAILRYNNAGWYADKVLTLIRAYDKMTPKQAGKGTGSGPGSGAGRWTLPVNARTGTPYHQSGAMWSSGYHTGVDFTAAVGTPVKAVGPGTVVTAGRGGSYGTQIVIRHPDGMYSQYAHLSDLHVTRGDTVKGGTRIGRSGATGNVSGPHLHFEIRSKPGYGSDISPLPYLRTHGLKI
ncbi:Murein DD-endopeptidase MepM [Streptomyces sp. YIM 130001]|uniref:peptidoglycan DD-metalloendopeptidase family protein n=1 Tax=Streptomyces sp. YIM 130001 TaxID=2259644 RepID=UPI000ECBE039|nr:peptidoglycan DD-metalloendopeptidase family protein [Streptomyces sp. YIM 130001]RII06956.1 Murein DD-endopeptidase MepM [Streptomyces sp. YIM 130001]